MRAEAGVLDEMFMRYKREAACEIGPGEGRITGRGRRCGECGEWCCNVSFFWFGCPFLFEGEGGMVVKRLVS